ncbi:Transposon Ty3-I Gag-Pol polyprotein [Fusarium oxysporum f. sp. albedinis]|nr:Transposon Ty3-I Gag-Pol polyprotein [Fusarium oxysporum f. sp. albedinis]
MVRRQHVYFSTGTLSEQRLNDNAEELERMLFNDTVLNPSLVHVDATILRRGPNLARSTSTYDPIDSSC